MSKKTCSSLIVVAISVVAGAGLFWLAASRESLQLKANFTFDRTQLIMEDLKNHEFDEKNLFFFGDSVTFTAFDPIFFDESAKYWDKSHNLSIPGWNLSTNSKLIHWFYNHHKQEDLKEKIFFTMLSVSIPQITTPLDDLNPGIESTTLELVPGINPDSRFDFGSILRKMNLVAYRNLGSFYQFLYFLREQFWLRDMPTTWLDPQAAFLKFWYEGDFHTHPWSESSRGFEFRDHPRSLSDLESAAKALGAPSGRVYMSWFWTQNSRRPETTSAKEYDPIDELIKMSKELKEISQYYVLVLPPRSELLHLSSYEKDSLNFLKSRLKQEGINFIDYTENHFSDSYFWDFSHLNRQGLEIWLGQLRVDIEKILRRSPGAEDY